MEEIEFKTAFLGGYADQHRVPAYDAAKALYGISRSIIIPAHYLLEGEVRHRNVASPKYQLFLSPPSAGSFEALLHFAFITGAAIAANPVSSAVAADLITKTVSATVKKAVGKLSQREEQELLKTEVVSPGDLAALSAAIEPGLREAHNIVNSGVININIFTGSDQIVTLDQSTKNYLNNVRADQDIYVQMMSVGTYNANSGSGSAFDRGEGRMIPFSIQKKIDRTSISTIMRSHTDYALSKFDEESDSFVAFQFRRTQDPYGNTKRIEVIKVRPRIDQL